MSFINYATKEINCKIVYFGPGLSGKTTNVQYIYEHTQNEARGKLVTLSTENERTLVFRFSPALRRRRSRVQDAVPSLHDPWTNLLRNFAANSF